MVSEFDIRRCMCISGSGTAGTVLNEEELDAR